MHRTLLRATGADVALALSALAGLVVLTAGDPISVTLRGAAWVAAGIALVARAGRRPEPTGAIGLLGGSHVVVGVTWLLVAASSTPDTPHLADLRLLTLGVAGIGVATLIATPSWQHRASLLDAVVGALAGAAVLVAIIGPAGTSIATVHAVAFATLLGPAVMLVGLLSPGLRPARGSLVAAFGMAALLHAGVATAVAVLTGGSVPRLAELTWIVVPVTALVLAFHVEPTYRQLRDRVAQRPTTQRLALLAVLAVVPVGSALAVAPDRLATGLVVSLAAALVLAARIAVSAQFDVEEARAAADVRFDALVEHAAEVLALLDGEGRLFYVSKAVHETFHVPPEQVLGRSPAELAHPDDVEEVEALIGRVGERPGVPLHARLRLLDGRGAARHVDVTVVDLRHVPGVNAISLTVRDVTERVTLEAELVRQARTDGLTGLVTRTVLIERADHVLTARQPAAALLFIDLDDFKLINDGYGHAAGDVVLATLAGRIDLLLRSHDTAGRIGGDEFAVLLEELTDDPVEHALRIAGRLAEAAREPVFIDGEPVEVRLSIGVALPQDKMTTAELFIAADAAMYEAKRDKRGVVLYQPGMRASSRSRLRLMRDVRTAIEEGTLDVSYQPIVSASTRELLGVEALLRWVHPTLGNITPDMILDHADAAGLTGELTRGIIERIGADLAAWYAQVGTPLDLAVNLSAQQLVHVEPERVLRVLAPAADAGGRLTIEVTETSMLGDLAAAARVLDVFREAGCLVAIDDFGTGYASIGYLRRLPLDKLKIDREFIVGLTPETVEGSFASVINGLAVALHLTTIAEGVETEEQLEAVRMLGCDMVQGFLFSEGLSMDDLITWVRDQRLAASLSDHT